MGHRYDILLVPSASDAVIEAFRTFRPQRPLRLTQFEQRLVGITGHRCGCVPSDYEQLALKLCPLAGLAVVVYYSLNGGGWRYQVYQQKRAYRSVGPVWDTQEGDADIWEMLKTTPDEVESRLFRNEIVCVTYPLMAEVLHRIPETEFHLGAANHRARLIRLAETLDRLIAEGQPFAAAKLLTDLGNQLTSVLSPPAHYLVSHILEAQLDGLNSAPFP